MTRYRQTMTFTIDVVADSPEEATEIAQEEYEKWDSVLWWITDTTVVVHEDDDDYCPINEEEDNWNG